MTTLINIYGGSGSGKSTVAAGLYYDMKVKGINCELVTEFVKQWAWEQRTIGPFDQLFISGNQSYNESRLYGKVDYIIADSPLLLGPIYEMFYNNGKSTSLDSVLNFIKLAEKSIKTKNFFLNRNVPFSNNGRYETEDQADEFDNFLKYILNDLEISYIMVNNKDEIYKEVMK